MSDLGLERVCTTCVLCVKRDYGYSNWTVEGTSIDCLLNLNPGFPTEDPWTEITKKEAAILDHAKQCKAYRQGVPAHLDVDGDVTVEKATDDEEARRLIRERGWE